jgi:hypothetical protein
VPEQFGMNLFLDTNVYLSFYKMSGDDVEELRKLSVTVQAKRTTLYLPNQVRSEFYRNRETTIAESLRLLQDAKLPTNFPRLFLGHPTYRELRDSLASYEERRAELLADVRRAAIAKELPADKLIGELFGLAQPIPLGDDIWQAAKRRVVLGNPPGKQQSYGDAINWESLLNVVPRGESLLLVTSDTDYMSKLEPGLISDFLRSEWTEQKESTVTVYATLSALFQDHYPDIRLAAELERELAIGRLIGSENFLETHAAVQVLSQHADFTTEQAQAMIEAANHNNQIRWILTDDDVFTFFTRIAARHADTIDATELADFWENVEPESEEREYEHENEEWPYK